jgi:hypothetical protein
MVSSVVRRTLSNTDCLFILLHQAVSIGSWDAGESTDEDERALSTQSAGTDCGSNKKYFKLEIHTDDYGFETSWALMREQSSATVKVASGPPSGTTYKDNNQYTGGKLFSVACNDFLQVVS